MKLQKRAISIALISIMYLILPLQVSAERLFTVYTVNYPLTYFAERIGGQYINSVFPAPADVDPAFWIPDVATVKQYQQADLIILNGAGYEKWTQKVSLPLMRSVDTSRAFKSDLLHIESVTTHSHGPGGDHSHGGTAFTTWLDFSQASQQAESIQQALSRKLPAHKEYFAKNYGVLKEELHDLDKRMLALSEKKPALPLVGSHPIYQYLARRYKVNLKMVMWEPDADPGDKEWGYFKKLVQDFPAEWMIWEGEPLPESILRLQEMNIQSQVFSPCFSRPEQGDFLSVMQQNVENLEKTFN